MTTQITDIITEIRDHINEPSDVASPFYGDDQIKRWVVRAVRELCSDTRLYLHHKLFTVTDLSQIGGDGMSFDIRQINTTSGEVLEKLEEFNYWDHNRQPIDWYQMWSTSMLLTKQSTTLPSMKRFGYMDNWTMYFNQAVAVGDMFALFGRFQPALTTASTVLPDFGGKQEKVEEFIIAKATYRGLLLKPTGIQEQFLYAKAWQSEADKLKEEVRIVVDQEYKQSYPHGMNFYKETTFMSPLRQQIVTP